MKDRKDTNVADEWKNDFKAINYISDSQFSTDSNLAAIRVALKLAWDQRVDQVVLLQLAPYRLPNTTMDQILGDEYNRLTDGLVDLAKFVLAIRKQYEGNKLIAIDQTTQAALNLLEQRLIAAIRTYASHNRVGQIYKDVVGYLKEARKTATCKDLIDSAIEQCLDQARRLDYDFEAQFYPGQGVSIMHFTPPPVQPNSSPSPMQATSSSNPHSSAQITIELSQPSLPTRTERPTRAHRTSFQPSLPTVVECYTLTYDDMLASANRSIQAFGLIHTKDIRKEPISSLFADFERDVTINHKARNEHLAQNNEIKENNFDAFLIDEFTEQNYQLLKQHYSQAALMFAGAIVPALSPANVIIKQPGAADRLSSDVYLEDGNVFFKAIFKRFPVFDNGEGSEFADEQGCLGYINGPLEVIFKLTENGFVLQELSTESALIRDIYKGIPIPDERISAETMLSRIAELLDDKQLNPLYIKMNSALTAYWNGDLNYNTLLLKLEKVMKQLKQEPQIFFNELLKSLAAERSTQKTKWENKVFADIKPINDSKHAEIKSALDEVWRYRVAKVMQSTKPSTYQAREDRLKNSFEHMQQLGQLAKIVLNIRETFASLSNVPASNELKLQMTTIELAVVNAIRQYREHNNLNQVYFEVSAKLNEFKEMLTLNQSAILLLAVEKAIDKCKPFIQQAEASLSEAKVEEISVDALDSLISARDQTSRIARPNYGFLGSPKAPAMSEQKSSEAPTTIPSNMRSSNSSSSS